MLLMLVLSWEPKMGSHAKIGFILILYLGLFRFQDKIHMSITVLEFYESLCCFCFVFKNLKFFYFSFFKFTIFIKNSLFSLRRTIYWVDCPWMNLLIQYLFSLFDSVWSYLLVPLVKKLTPLVKKLTPFFFSWWRG